MFQSCAGRPTGRQAPPPHPLPPPTTTPLHPHPRTHLLCRQRQVEAGGGGEGGAGRFDGNSRGFSSKVGSSGALQQVHAVLLVLELGRRTRAGGGGAGGAGANGPVRRAGEGLCCGQLVAQLGACRTLAGCGGRGEGEGWEGGAPADCAARPPPPPSSRLLKLPPPPLAHNSPGRAAAAPGRETVWARCTMLLR